MKNNTIMRHYVDAVEYSSIVEVLKEKNVASLLGYKSDNYTGTAIYSALAIAKASLGEGIRIGASDYYPKHKVETLVEEYLNRGMYKENVKEVIRLVRDNPSVASKILAIIK